MNVVILTRNVPNQVALCHLLKSHCNIKAIIVSENIPRKKPDFLQRKRLLLNRICNRLVGRVFVKTWFNVLNEYKKDYSKFPDVPLINVRNINDSETLETLGKFSPDLVIVSSTNLVGKKIIKIAERKSGIVNLHTGLSPYVKGGPNCTNWCLAEKWFHLIGNTVMWLDSGIDTGRIITTEQTPLDGTEDLFNLHYKNMKHANDLYVRAISYISQGKSVPSIPQNSICEGKTFYSVDWNAAAMIRAKRNFERYYSAYFADAENRYRLASGLILVPLSD